MAERATGFNPRLLRWARERAGMSIEEAAARIGKTPETLAAWETGEQAPTYLQLEALAETVYHRPVALLFFPEPPEEETPTSEFRTVPEFDLDSLAPDTHFAIRDAHAYLTSIRELAGGKSQAERLVTTDIRANLNVDPQDLAQRVRAYLGVSPEDQFAWGSTRDAMAEWREAVEATGVFVIKRSFKQDEISGFCIFDAQFPLIVVNNSHPFTRQSFTLFHELGHLLFGVSTIAKTSQGYVDRFAGEARRIEVACNRFAAEVLVPQTVLSRLLRGSSADIDAIPDLATRFKVSRVVVLRRFLDRQVVDQTTYERLAAEWDEDARSGSGEGGNYYATKASYLGNALLKLAFGQYNAGKITAEQLSEHLDIKPKNMGKLEAFLLAHE